VPTITLTMDTLNALGVSLADLLPILQRETVTLLEPLLASRGFDVTKDVRVVVLATGDGVVLTQ
jgi:hypothetical protein